MTPHYRLRNAVSLSFNVCVPTDRPSVPRPPLIHERKVKESLDLFYILYVICVIVGSTVKVTWHFVTVASDLILNRSRHYGAILLRPSNSLCVQKLSCVHSDSSNFTRSSAIAGTRTLCHSKYCQPLHTKIALEKA